jgi:hypothetical protein
MNLIFFQSSTGLLLLYTLQHQNHPFCYKLGLIALQLKQQNVMGNYFANSLAEKQMELGIRSRLADLKQAKKQRDFTVAMQMAQTRDRVYWMCAFYGAMIAVSVSRMVALRSIEPLPLRYVPYVLVPFMVGYQAGSFILSV